MKKAILIAILVCSMVMPIVAYATGTIEIKTQSAANRYIKAADKSVKAYNKAAKKAADLKAKQEKKYANTLFKQEAARVKLIQKQIIALQKANDKMADSVNSAGLIVNGLTTKVNIAYNELAVAKESVVDGVTVTWTTTQALTQPFPFEPYWIHYGDIKPLDPKAK